MTSAPSPDERRTVSAETGEIRVSAAAAARRVDRALVRTDIGLGPRKRGFRGDGCNRCAMANGRLRAPRAAGGARRTMVNRALGFAACGGGGAARKRPGRGRHGYRVPPRNNFERFARILFRLTKDYQRVWRRGCRSWNSSSIVRVRGPISPSRGSTTSPRRPARRSSGGRSWSAASSMPSIRPSMSGAPTRTPASGAITTRTCRTGRGCAASPSSGRRASFRRMRSPPCGAPMRRWMRAGWFPMRRRCSRPIGDATATSRTARC